MSRSFERNPTELRPVRITTGVSMHAEGSALVEFGNTRVLCAASVDKSVPPWLQGQGQGWVTAEYAMLPRATNTRTRRERDKVSGRTLEIQRLVGRSLRGVVDLKKMADYSVVVDCDVLQADGGTRTASITGGFVALALALRKMGATVAGFRSALSGQVAAVSVGVKGGQVLVDLDYGEDSSCEVDMNVVMMGDGKFVEVQGTAERGSFAKEQLDAMLDAGSAAIRELFRVQREALEGVAIGD